MTESVNRLQENKSATHTGHYYDVRTFNKESRSLLGNAGKCDGEDRGSHVHSYKVDEVTDNSKCLIGNVYDPGFALDFLK